MKIVKTILALLISVSSVYSQKDISKIEKFSQKVLQNASKGNIWVMDVMKSYTGQGSSNWDFDYTEIVLERNSKGLPTLIETKEKIEGTANWVNYFRAEISYHNNDTISEYKLKEWNTNTNSWLSELSYYETKDEDGKKLIHFSRAWSNENGFFTQGYKEIYTYDVDGVLSEMEDRDWDYINSVWTNWAKTFFTYDVDNNLILKLNKKYQSGTYNDNWKTEYTYDASGRLSLEQEWVYDYGWYDYSKNNYTYYENGLLNEELYELYYAKGWENTIKNTYTYTTAGLIESLESHDYDNANVSSLEEYTYDINDNNLRYLFSDWNGDNWSLSIQTDYYYDDNKNMTSFVQIARPEGTWVNSLKEEYTWVQFTSVNNLNNLKVKIYPNPATNKLYIISEEVVSIKIVNITGQVIFNSIKKSSNFKLNISNYPSGIYFIELSSLNGGKTLKFFKK